MSGWHEPPDKGDWLIRAAIFVIIVAIAFAILWRNVPADQSRRHPTPAERAAWCARHSPPWNTAECEATR